MSVKWKDIKERKIVDSGERERMGLSVQGMSSFDRIKVMLSSTSATIEFWIKYCEDVSRSDHGNMLQVSSLFFSVPGK